MEETAPILTCRVSKLQEDEDVLKLYKAEYSEVKETSFLLDCFPVLKIGLLFLKEGRGTTSEEKY